MRRKRRRKRIWKKTRVVENQLTKCPGRSLKMNLAFTSKFWLFWLQGKVFVFKGIKAVSIISHYLSVSGIGSEMKLCPTLGQ